MDYPFIEGLSDIQETQILGSSRTTLPGSIRNHNILSNIEQQFAPFPNFQLKINDEQEQPNYSSLRDYVEKTLNSWGLKIGYLPQNSQNKLTINCLMQLISQKFSQQDNREQLKKSLSQTSYSRNKFQSLYQQQKLQKNQKNKLVGRLENTLEQMKLKNKLIQGVAKKQKQEDKKMIAMLKSKNEQIMHQVKKRQQEFNKMKQQMKKNVGQKNVSKGVNFQIYQANQSFSITDNYDKIESLTKIYENQRKSFMKQNLLLRQKIYDIKEELIKFLQWILERLYKNANINYTLKNKMIINHNLLFKKQSLVVELRQIIEQTKLKLNQLMINNEQNISQKANHQNVQYLKKQKSSNYQENITPNKSKQISIKKPQPRHSLLNMQNQRKSLPIKNSKLEKMNSRNQELLIEGDSQLSMISHVSAVEIVKENKKFDKWEILFNND